jgi:hypothetical protein
MVKSALRRIFFPPGAGLQIPAPRLYLPQGDYMKTMEYLQPLMVETKTDLESNDLFRLNKALDRFNPVGLEDIEKQNLLSRTDTKFLFEAESLPEILTSLESEYSILEINEETIHPYLTLYFDTPAFDNYFAHHNGKIPRFKIRMRKYLNSQTAFLEVKEKDNKDRTIKTRREIPDINSRLSPEHYQFINEAIPLGIVPLKPVIWNSYSRLTLVNRDSLERVTIDLNFNASNPNGFISWNQFAIAEIKQDSFSLNTPFHQALKSRAIKPVKFSKYCISMALLTPQLKANRFKPNIGAIKHCLQRRMVHAF